MCCFFYLFFIIKIIGEENRADKRNYEITDSRIFSDNPALLVFVIYQCLTLCKKLEKSLERFSWKSVNQPTTPGSSSPKGEN